MWQLCCIKRQTTVIALRPPLRDSYLARMSYYKGKTIWITGASAGIGEALALALAKKGASLILSSRKKAGLDKVASACKTKGAPKVDVLPLDLAEHALLDTLITENQALLAQVDMLINNGGISQRSQVTETDFAVYKKLMDVNYLGTVKLSLGVLPFFKQKNSGHYVSISSMAGKFGVPGRSGYSASKMALHGFFDALRAELRTTGIKVTLICPGYIKTDISLNALTSDGSPQGTLDAAQRNGMDVATMVDKTLNAIARGREEVHIGGFKEVKMAGFVARVFPATFRKIIAKAKTT